MNLLPRQYVVLSLILSCTSATAMARAGDVTPGDAMAAEAAFSDARRLMKEGHFEEACPKLETSYRLDPALGTLLNLSECFVRTGRTASGWLHYREAAAMALRQGETKREAIARERAKALEPRLCRLIVHAPDTAGELRRDGTLVRREDRGEAVPIDPGTHILEASGRGFAPYIVHVEIVGPAEGACKQVVVDIPAALGGVKPEPAPAASPVAAPAHERIAVLRREPLPAAQAPSRWAVQHTLSLASVGVGIVALGIGAGFALDASATERDADAHCQPAGCTSEARDGHAAAGRSADIATASIITGAAFLVTGAILWWTSPSLHRSPMPRGVALRF
ncbi:hypothetical protein LZC95_34395 [Pendulispora brunnea]|uniref:PEGA domain-containing protein n=1 Tax=Pendulispora brunnea TaxID=2905690 RepID=A0ABZ2K5B6_9BACT